MDWPTRQSFLLQDNLGLHNDARLFIWIQFYSLFEKSRRSNCSMALKCVKCGFDQKARLDARSHGAARRNSSSSKRATQAGSVGAACFGESHKLILR